MYRSVDDKNCACYHGNIKIDYSNFGLDLRMISQ